jgi:hypothetical protein
LRNLWEEAIKTRVGYALGLQEGCIHEEPEGLEVVQI